VARERAKEIATKTNSNNINSNNNKCANQLYGQLNTEKAAKMSKNIMERRETSRVRFE